METFNILYNKYLELCKLNPLVATLLPLWAMVVITFALKVLPIRILTFFKRQFTTSLSFNNSGWGDANLQFTAFMKWFSETKWSKFSRSLAISHDYDLGLVVGCGYGNHFFFYKGRPFIFTKGKLESSGTHIEKEEIRITTIGRKHSYIIDLVNHFKHVPKSNEISIYDYNFSDGWICTSPIKKRSLDTVIIEEDTKNKIVKDLQYFFDNKEWYNSRGMPHKLSYIFHGVPGTGKTSFIKALASHYNKNVYKININNMTDDSFAKCIAKVPSGSFIIIEDFDSASAFKSRKIVQNPNERKPAVSSESLPSPVEKDNNDVDLSDLFSGSLTLSGVLNTLDGIVSLDDVVIFMTTNNLYSIDAALTRKGRTDHIVELKRLTNKEIRTYINMMYGNDVSIPENVVFEDIAGCDLQALFLESKEDSVSFINSIPVKSNVH